MSEIGLHYESSWLRFVDNVAVGEVSFEDGGLRICDTVESLFELPPLHNVAAIKFRVYDKYRKGTLRVRVCEERGSIFFYRHVFAGHFISPVDRLSDLYMTYGGYTYYHLALFQVVRSHVLGVLRPRMRPYYVWYVEKGDE